MESIIKTPSNQAPPYNSQSNYTITWDIEPALYDFESGYVLAPVSLTETQGATVRGGSYAGAVNNLSLTSPSGQVNLATANVNVVRMSVDGSDIYYCREVNKLIASLGVCEYNLPQERLEEYFSGNTQTYPAGLASGSALNYSIFRELYNSGTVPSVKYNASLRIPVSKLLSGFTDQIRDLRKYSSIQLSIELADISGFISSFEPDPEFGSDVRMSGATNTVQWGTAYNGAFPGGNAIWTSTDDFTVANFPYGVGDQVTFTTAGLKTISQVAQSGSKVAVTVAGGNVAGAADTIPANSVGTFKQYMITGQTSAALAQATFPVNSRVCVFNATNNLCILNTTILQYAYSGGNVRILLSQSSGVQLSGTYIATAPLFLSYAATPGNGNPLPADLPTSEAYTDLTFPLWVSQPVLVSSLGAAFTTMSTTISAISYAGGFAQLTFAPPVTATSGAAIAANTLCVIPQKAVSVAIGYPELFNHIQYRLNERAAGGASDLYRRWVYDADTMPALSAYGQYDKTFILDPDCDFVVVALCTPSQLTSDVGSLLSYRLLIDGNATTSREIILSGDQTFRYERLLNGYAYLSDDLDAISTSQAVNPMSLDAGTYVILQDLIVDGKSHRLTVSLKNGNGSYSQRTVGVYKRVYSKLP